MSKALSQADHERINAREYPRTRQICTECGEPTERCEDDSLYLDDGKGPLCPNCYRQIEESFL